jgi:hypothetical protein
LYLVVQLFLSFSASDEHENGATSIEGPQDIVIVTVFDNATMSEDYMRIVRANRDHYAARYGIANLGSQDCCTTADRA